MNKDIFLDITFDEARQMNDLVGLAHRIPMKILKLSLPKPVMFLRQCRDG